jgi:hypothetical protein
VKKKKRRKTPRFVKVKLLRDGEVELRDDDGEIFHVEMRRDDAWPMVSRRMRRFEMRDVRPPKPPPPSPSGLRLVKK